jgi:MoaA/NifB/PqqE/SkfB family radical SAM enzyme
MTENIRYGFYGRLKQAYPSQINVDLTEVCNLECVHCPHPTFKKSEFYGARFLDPVLNKKLVDEVREFSEGCTQYIRYSSAGEPLIHPKGYEMIQYAVEESGVYVTLTTNGTIMNEKRTKKLLDSGIHMIDISIDAYSPEVYKKIRVGGDLNITNKNVSSLIKWIQLLKVDTKVVVSFVEQAGNSSETEKFKRYWEEQGADYVIIRRVHSASGAVKEIAKTLWSEANGVTRRPCTYPWERIVLTPAGNLAFCPADWSHGSTFEDFRKKTIGYVWKSKFYKDLRNAHLDNNFSNHKFCGQCPDWQQMRWPDEGRAYADLIQEFMGDDNSTETIDN